MPETVITAKEASKIVGCHPKTLLSLARKGMVPAYPMGRRWVFTESSLLAWRDKKLQSNCHPVPTH